MSDVIIFIPDLAFLFTSINFHSISIGSTLIKPRMSAMLVTNTFEVDFFSFSIRSPSDRVALC